MNVNVSLPACPRCDSPRWDAVSAEARDFVAQCLTVDPAKRPSAASLLKHAWLTAKDSEVCALETCLVDSRPLKTRCCVPLAGCGPFSDHRVSQVVGREEASEEGIRFCCRRQPLHEVYVWRPCRGWGLPTPSSLWRAPVEN